jgi:uncharacterized protein (DUF1015 family)
MPSIQAFHGLRYDLGHVGSLSDVVAPPYDVIDERLQDELYKRHPANVVRLILNRREPGDASEDTRYERAARFLRNWRREGVLQAESQAAIYVYSQEFVWDRQTYDRHGFMCRARLEPFGTGRIFPHEETHSAAKADRLKLTKACKANLSQIFGLYPDPANQVRSLLEAATAGQMPLTATDHLGVVHRMWPVSDVKLLSELSALMDPKPIFIADGHHRYETALAYRDFLAAQSKLPVDHPANFVLMMCVGMSDPGMIVLPTHRLLRGIPALTSAQLCDALGACFTAHPLGTGPELASRVWAMIDAEGQQRTLGLYTAPDRQWVLARITEAGRARMAELTPQHSREWQGLGVSILHELIVRDLLRQDCPPSPKYVHSIEEVVDGIEHGDAVGRDATGQMGQGGEFPLVALVMPATLAHVRTISERGERMPAKSTYFYPKLLSGLVINPLT